MEYICIEIIETGERRRIDRPVWIMTNRSGIQRTTKCINAVGVGDGERIWSFGALEGCPRVKIITLAEYLEYLTEPNEDPELSAEAALNIILGGNYEKE